MDQKLKTEKVIIKLFCCMKSHANPFTDVSSVRMLYGLQSNEGGFFWFFLPQVATGENWDQTLSGATVGAK